MGFPSLSALESIGRIDAGEMYAVKIMDVRNSSDAPQPHIWRDEMGTIQAWILSSTALPGSGGYFFLGYGSGHGRSFFILFWGVIWTEVTEANMSQFDPICGTCSLRVCSGFEVGLRNLEAPGLATSWGDPFPTLPSFAREARSEARLLSEVSGHPNVVALPLGR